MADGYLSHLAGWKNEENLFDHIFYVYYKYLTKCKWFYMLSEIFLLPVTSMTTSSSTRGSMVSRSLSLNQPLGWIRSERNVPEFNRAQSAWEISNIMSVIKFPTKIIIHVTLFLPNFMKSNIPELFIIVLNNFSLFCTVILETFIFFSIKEERESK